MEKLILLFSLISLGLTIGWLLTFFQNKMKLKEAAFENKMIQEKLLQLEKMQQLSSEQFKGMSAEALKHNNEVFLQVAEQTFEKFHDKNKMEFEKKGKAIDDLIKPVEESLKKFDGKIHELEKARLGAYVSLKEQVQSLIDTQKELRLETSNLSKALRTPAVRGRWGEMQLKRVVEMAGMMNHCDFFEQATAADEKRRYRPDLIVKLPGGRNIVIDAKTPLMAYLDGMESNDDEIRYQKMKEHAQHIRNHIVLLSRKAYWEQFQPTPNFVVLFLPAESFFSAALEQDPALIEAGVDRNVILATPTTLIALLRTVASQWREERLTQDVEQIKKLGKDLYKRLADMGGHWIKVGKGLESAVQNYNRAIGSLESRVLVSARRFMDLGSEKQIEILNPIEQLPRTLQVQEVPSKDETNEDQKLPYNS